MLYAKEVIGLMAAHPGRDFRLVEIRRYVEVSINATDRQRRHAVRIGVTRVLHTLIECKTVQRNRDVYGSYRWRSDL